MQQNETLQPAIKLQAPLAQNPTDFGTNLLYFSHHEKVQHVAGQFEDLSIFDIPWWLDVT